MESKADFWMMVMHSYSHRDIQIVIIKPKELEKINSKFAAWRKRTGDKSLAHVSFKNAAKIFKDMITKKNFDDFLTLPLYEKI